MKSKEREPTLRELLWGLMEAPTPEEPKLKPSPTTWTRAEAESVARSIASGEKRIEDYDPRVTKWKSEETIREAIKYGDISIRQFSQEVERRQRTGIFGVETVHFVDEDEIK